MDMIVTAIEKLHRHYYRTTTRLSVPPEFENKIESTKKECRTTMKTLYCCCCGKMLLCANAIKKSQNDDPPIAEDQKLAFVKRKDCLTSENPTDLHAIDHNDVQDPPIAEDQKPAFVKRNDCLTSENPNDSESKTQYPPLKKKTTSVKVWWYIQELSYEHCTECSRIIENSILGISRYNVHPAVIEAASNLSGLSKRWWSKRKQTGSILQQRDPRDQRYYGIFYHQNPPSFATFQRDRDLSFFDLHPLFVDEMRDFNRFYSITVANQQEIKGIMELVILFLEDFKFEKCLHTQFAQDKKELFLSAIGFIAGGNQVQTLHCDVPLCPAINEPFDGSTLPLSMLVPIGSNGRDLHLFNREDNHTKLSIKKGQACCFDGNVPHAGAKSEGKKPLERLALHIHIDSKFYLRHPNTLILHVDNEDEDETKQSTQTSKTKKLKITY